MQSSRGFNHNARSPYDLDVFPSERIGARKGKVPVPIALGVLCSVVFGVAAAGTLWVVIGRTPDADRPQLPEVKERVQTKAEEPDSKWLTPLLLPMALQSFEGPLPEDSARANAANRQALPSAGTKGRAVGQVVQPPLSAAGPSQASPVAPTSAPALLARSEEHTSELQSH
mgnify:CR=1 FL=1